MKIVREIMSYVIIILLVIVVRMFIITPVRVDGPSMNPTYEDGQILLLNKLKRNFDYLDVIVFKHGEDELIKRVIGRPGDTVEIKHNKIYINGLILKDYDDNVLTDDFSLSSLGYQKIPDGYYFVLGDNRSNSADSRLLGLVSYDKIKGNVVFRIFPFSKFGTIK